MSIFEQDPKPINYTGVPGWELPGYQAEEKRRREELVINEVATFEREKAAVNLHVAQSVAVLGRADIAQYPLEAATNMKRNA